MTARILIVDDNPTNAKLLEARLTAEYFEVVIATDGPTALKICADGRCDIVLLDVVMPGMSGLEVCRRLKQDPRTAHIPVVIVTRLDQPSDRVAGLEAGADDFLTAPTSTVSLTTRLRSLMRLKSLTDALVARSSTTAVGLDTVDDITSLDGDDARILLVADDNGTVELIRRYLGDDHNVDHEANPQEALFKVAEGDYEVAIVSLNLTGVDGLRLCSQLRSLDRTHLMPILVLVDADDSDRLMRALDIGVNDYLLLPLDGNELKARVRTQVRRKRFTDKLRDNVQMTIEMALTDGLTGLRNRRYLERQLVYLLKEADEHHRPLSLMVLDIDHFKSVNDTYGHPAGDAVLREFAKRLKMAVRGIDLVARIGGEEFVIAMPETDGDLALRIGERLREKISDDPFVLTDGPGEVPVTVSIGLSTHIYPGNTAEGLIGRADAALYRAKREGRNRIISTAA